MGDFTSSKQIKLTDEQRAHIYAWHRKNNISYDSQNKEFLEDWEGKFGRIYNPKLLSEFNSQRAISQGVN